MVAFETRVFALEKERLRERRESRKEGVVALETGVFALLGKETSVCVREGRVCVIDGRVCGQGLAFTRYCFTSSRFCTSQSFFSFSDPPALLTVLQYYCTTTGQYTTPLAPCCIVYTIHYYKQQYRVKAKAGGRQAAPPLLRARLCLDATS